MDSLTQRMDWFDSNKCNNSYICDNGAKWTTFRRGNIDYVRCG